MLGARRGVALRFMVMSPSTNESVTCVTAIMGAFKYLPALLSTLVRLAVYIFLRIVSLLLLLVPLSFTSADPDKPCTIRAAFSLCNLPRILAVHTKSSTARCV